MTEQEIKARNKSLCDRMPYLIPRNVWTDKVVEDYDYERIRGDYELPDGWKRLFLQMCEDIRQPLINASFLDEFRFSQIKEKYGIMRCYNFGAPEEVQRIIDHYEYISQFVCEVCGKPAKYETEGWVSSYCEDCIKKLRYEPKTEPINLKLKYKVERYSGKTNEKQIMEYDVSDIWNRYIKSLE